MLTKNTKNILFVGCHPDDIEIGCGGTVVKHIENGDVVSVMVMTNGDQGKHTQSRKECYNSLKKLGVKNILFGNYPDGYLSDSHEVVNFIETHIKNLKIDRVYTHDVNDRHQDHRNCSRAVSAAARKVNEILFYQGPSTNVHFEPHYYIKISEKQLQKKISSLRCYKTQIEKGIVDLRWIKNLAGVNGAVCYAPYAEAYALNHIVADGV